MSPKITLEKLAEMIQAQFVSIDEQLKEIRSTMVTKEEMNERFSSLETRLTNQIDQLRDSIMILKATVGIR